MIYDTPALRPHHGGDVFITFPQASLLFNPEVGEGRKTRKTTKKKRKGGDGWMDGERAGLELERVERTHKNRERGSRHPLIYTSKA